MKNWTFRLIGPSAAVAAFLLIACDPFQEDSIQKDKQVVFSPGRTVYYILPNSSTIIDLKSIVQTSFTNISLTIADGAERGNLSRLSSFLVKYEPRPDFIEGHDRFTFSVSSANGSILKTDTVFIMMGQDVANFPCRIYAVEDFTSIKPGTKVSIPFLENDRICGVEKKDLDKSIFSEPQHGMATLSEDVISYTSNPGYEGWDQFVYRINGGHADSVTTSFGVISILVDDEPCGFDLKDDHFTYITTSFSPTWFELNVLANDDLCFGDSTTFAEAIVQTPAHGTARPIGKGKIRYESPSAFTGSWSDSFAYRLCYKGICKEATVRIDFSYVKYAYRIIENEFVGLRIKLYFDADVEMCCIIENLTYPAHDGDADYVIYYDVIRYSGEPKAVDFNVTIQALSGTINGKKDSIYFQMHDTGDLWNGPKPAQYFTRWGTNNEFTGIDPDAGHVPVDLTMNLEFFSSEDTLSLIQGKTCWGEGGGGPSGSGKYILTATYKGNQYDTISTNIFDDDMYIMAGGGFSSLTTKSGTFISMPNRIPVGNEISGHGGPIYKKGKKLFIYQ